MTLLFSNLWNFFKKVFVDSRTFINMGAGRPADAFSFDDVLFIPAAHYVFTGIDSTMIVDQVISLMPVLATAFHSGVLEDRLVLLDEDNGEKCILLEMLKNHRERITAEIIKKQVGNNCEKEYHCGYKKNGRCTCSEEKIEKILDTLKNRNILKGGSAGYQYIV